MYKLTAILTFPCAPFSGPEATPGQQARRHHPSKNAALFALKSANEKKMLILSRIGRDCHPFSVMIPAGNCPIFVSEKKHGCLPEEIRVK